MEIGEVNYVVQCFCVPHFEYKMLDAIQRILRWIVPPGDLTIEYFRGPAAQCLLS